MKTSRPPPLTTDQVGLPILQALGIDPSPNPVRAVTLRLRVGRLPTVTIERYLRAPDGNLQTLEGKLRTEFARYELALKAGEPPAPGATS